MTRFFTRVWAMVFFIGCFVLADMLLMGQLSPLAAVVQLPACMVATFQLLRRSLRPVRRAAHAAAGHRPPPAPLPRRKPLAPAPVRLRVQQGGAPFRGTRPAA